MVSVWNADACSAVACMAAGFTGPRMAAVCAAGVCLTPAGCAVVVGVGTGSACDCCARVESERKAAPSSAPLRLKIVRLQCMYVPREGLAGASNEVLGLLVRDFRARACV